MWNLEEAIDFSRSLEEVLVPVGFHCGISGSVLIKGHSDDDLDLVVYPHSSGNICIDDLYNSFDAIGMILKSSRSKVTETWEGKGSSDMKNVEIWHTPEGKRVDVFHLK